MTRPNIRKNFTDLTVMSLSVIAIKVSRGSRMSNATAGTEHICCKVIEQFWKFIGTTETIREVKICFGIIIRFRFYCMLLQCRQKYISFAFEFWTDDGWMT
jgi:hypothetical protein